MAQSPSNLQSMMDTLPTTPALNQENLTTSEKQIFEFFELLDEIVVDQEFGTVTVTAVIEQGVPSIEKTTVVSSKKIKYQYDRSNHKDNT